MKKILIVFFAVCLVTIFTACELDSEDTFFVRHATLSVATYNFTQTTPGITAQQAYSHALQFPVIPDPALEIRTGQTRQQVIDYLNTAGNTAFTNQIMALIDQTGSAFATYMAINGLYYYVYVIIE